MRHLKLSLLALAALCSAANADTTFIVDPASGGTHKTIKEALAAVAPNSTERTIIKIKPGTYNEGRITVSKDKPNVSFIGEDSKTTVITHGDNVKQPVPEGSPPHIRGTGVVVQGDGFRAENITFENTAGDDGQAMALRTEADRVIVKNCRLLGWQDTLLTHSGRHYYKDCYIEGRVDFIYGAATAVFDHCHIHSKNGGYVTAASTPKETEFGYVFLDCKLTGDDKPWQPPASSTQPAKPVERRAYLGRPWRPFAAVAFLRCEMDDHIRPEGWNNWRNVENEKTARYSEYKSTGPGANPSVRQPWTKQLTDEEAAKYTVANVLKGADGWDPTKE